MKPHVLLLLLLAIPPLICDILAGEIAEKSDVVPALSPDLASKFTPANHHTAPKDSPAPVAPVVVTPSVAAAPAPAPAAASTKSTPSRSGAASSLKAWYMFW